jgi:hypothetical protein
MKSCGVQEGGAAELGQQVSWRHQADFRLFKEKSWDFLLLPRTNAAWTEK